MLVAFLKGDATPVCPRADRAVGSRWLFWCASSLSLLRAGEEREGVASREGDKGRLPKVGLSEHDTSVAGEGGITSSSFIEPSVEIEMALERTTFEVGSRTFFFGVDGTDRESSSGAVFDL